MPSGTTHDRITYALATLTLGLGYALTSDVRLALTTTAAMLFAGLMFGPDLDIYSKPYQRWGIFRFIWKPYQMALSHRSSLSHGLVFSTVIRVVYLLAVVSILSATAAYAWEILWHGIGGAKTTWGEEFSRGNAAL